MLILVLGTLGLGLCCYVVLRVVLDVEKGPLWLPHEKNFVDPSLDNALRPFPSLFDLPTVYLSVIVPAYNEEERLPVMMKETLEFLTQRERQDPTFSYEIIVVDDGSKDKTSEVALQFSAQYSAQKVRILRLQKNRGKGGAVKRGMLCARGEHLLFADADGATKFSDIDKLEKELRQIENAHTTKQAKNSHNNDKLGLVVGSRAHLEKEAIAKRTPLRNFLMYGFHMLVNVLGVRGIRDTQCGFKMLTRRTAQLVFANLHIERWAFDVELIFLAQHFSVPIVEVSVNWKEIPGSKLSPVAASIQMGKDMLRIRSGYWLRFWKINANPVLENT